eukprot:1311245-Ditylum_brightwellii.AAC.1
MNGSSTNGPPDYQHVNKNKKRSWYGSCNQQKRDNSLSSRLAMRQCTKGPLLVNSTTSGSNFGVAVNTLLDKWENAKHILLSMPTYKYFNRLSKIIYHNVCSAV